MTPIDIIGGGLAGCEAAYQLAKRGIPVRLYEMRPAVTTEAHKTEKLAELVCSNSLKSLDENTSQGLLKYELRLADSMILRAAEATCVPAGNALAVDREKFSLEVERELSGFSSIEIVRTEHTALSAYTIVASGPLTSQKLTSALEEFFGKQNLSFYDAVAPIVASDSVDRTRSFYAGRYGKGGEDYLNCPLTREEYYEFVDNLIKADKVLLREFEKRDVFQACMPVEVMAERGVDSLRFGPLRPVGLYDREGKRPFAVIQLRKEDNFDGLLNLVGFQTNLKFGEQKRVFSMIPALKNAEFVRYGVMHRNTFVDAPSVLTTGFRTKKNEKLFIAGQLSGVEGYMESAMSGLLAGVNAFRTLSGQEIIDPPETTATGSLMKYLVSENNRFQPMHVNFGLLPELNEKVRDKKKRKEEYANRAKSDFAEYAKKYF